jgi:hypothetical protein
MRSPKPLLDDPVGQFDRGVEIFGILKLRPVEQQFRPLRRTAADFAAQNHRHGPMGQGWEFHLTFPSPSFRDERLETNIAGRPAALVRNHFILKAIWRKCPDQAVQTFAMATCSPAANSFRRDTIGDPDRPAAQSR